jgi:adenylate kinase family enzyme
MASKNSLNLKAFSKDMFDEYLGRLSKPFKEPVAVFTIGLPASGKTSLTKYILDKKMGIKMTDIIHLDPDDLDHEYQLGLKKPLSTLKIRPGVITASNIYNDIVTHTDKPSVVYYGTGRNNSQYRSMMKKARTAGYQIVIVHVHIDLEVAVHRNNLRSQLNSTRVQVGRNIITKIHFDISKPLNKPIIYKDLQNFKVLYSLADRVFYVDNSADRNETNNSINIQSISFNIAAGKKKKYNSKNFRNSKKKNNNKRKSTRKKGNKAKKLLHLSIKQLKS